MWKHSKIAPESDTVESIPWSDVSIDTTVEQKGFLGKGSFSIVMRGYWTRNQRGRPRPVAIKIFTSSIAEVSSANFDALCEEAMKEARILLKAKQAMHNADHIINVYGVAIGPLSESLSAAFPIQVRSGESAFGIIMEYEGGGSLENLINPPSTELKSSLPMVEKVRILLDIATGLVDLHEVGIVHGDIKTQNILFSVKIKAKLADFGMAGLASTTRDFGASTVHQTSKVRGTPIYLAPEMIDQGKGSVARSSRSSDIYAFAILSWYLLAEKV